MNHIVLNPCILKIEKFYRNVLKKYKHTFSIEDMKRNVNNTLNAISSIENGLLRRKPTISRWRGMYMATSEDRRWYFAYRIDGDTIYVEDACHAQNMHEAKQAVRITISELAKIIKEAIKEELRNFI